MLLGARVGRPCLKCSGRKLVLVTVSSAGIDGKMEERIGTYLDTAECLSQHMAIHVVREATCIQYLGRSCYSMIPTCLNSWQDQ